MEIERVRVTGVGAVEIGVVSRLMCVCLVMFRQLF